MTHAEGVMLIVPSTWSCLDPWWYLLPGHLASNCHMECPEASLCPCKGHFVDVDSNWQDLRLSFDKLVLRCSEQTSVPPLGPRPVPPHQYSERQLPYQLQVSVQQKVVHNLSKCKWKRKGCFINIYQQELCCGHLQQGTENLWEEDRETIAKADRP